MSLRIKKGSRKTAQATLEYLVLLTVVIAAFIVMVLLPGNYFHGVMNNALRERAMTMDAYTATLDSSDPDIPAL